VSRRRRGLHELRVRTCLYGDRCLVCLDRIRSGERYRDGGHGRRAHLACADEVAVGRRSEPTRAQLRELEAAESAVAWAKGGLYVARRDGRPVEQATAKIEEAEA